MKCPTCESCEYEQYCGATEIMRKCERHNKKVKQTNEEYIRSCSSEELAKLIYKIAVTDVLMDRFFTAEIVNAEIVNEHIGIKEAEAWLKEKHDDSV